MNSASALRFLLLVIPVVWIVTRLLPTEHLRDRNLKAIASQEYQSQQPRQGMTGQDAKVAISPAEFLMLFLTRVGMNPG